MKRILLIVGVVGGFSLLVVMLFYATGASPLAKTIGSTLNLPIASIDGSWIYYKDFQTQVDGLKLITESESVSERELRYKVWEKIVKDFAIRRAALERNITVSPDTRDTIALQLGIDIDAAEFKMLLDAYENDKDRIYQSIIDPIILELQLTQALVMEQNNDASVYIQNIKQQLDLDPAKFVELRSTHMKTYNLSENSDEILLTETDFKNAGLVEYFDTFVEGSISGVIGSYDGYRLYSIKRVFIEPERTYQLSEIYVPVQLLEPLLNDIKNGLKIKIFAPSLIQI